MRVKVLLSFLVFSLPIALAQSTGSPRPNRQPVNTTQLAAWLTGGVPSTRLARLVAERGLANLPTRNELHQMESLGADKELMRVLSSGNVFSARIGPPVPDLLLKAAAEVRQQQFHQAENDLRDAVSADPENPALHFALGVVYLK